ncbi:MAG: electron transfer flavoprotein subunit beta/FixA family protein [Nitrososphaeria archaeon]
MDVPLNVVVGIKWVPNNQAVRFDEKTGTLIREGVTSIVNPHDLDAVELALRLKDRYGGRVTAISMSPPSATKGLEHVLGMGVDEAVLISDRAFAGADTLATSYVISRALGKLGDFDLALFGQETIDSSTAHIPAQVAGWLGLPYLYYATEVEAVDEERRSATVRRLLEDRVDLYELSLPAVLGVAMNSNVPRPVRLSQKLRVRTENPIKTWTNDALKLDARCTGLRGSPTIVAKSTWTPEVPRKRQILDGTPEEAVKKLVEILAKEGVI